jgi:hypothetical protein
MSHAGQKIVSPGYSEDPVSKRIARHGERASWQVARGQENVTRRTWERLQVKAYKSLSKEAGQEGIQVRF